MLLSKIFTAAPDLEVHTVRLLHSVLKKEIPNIHISGWSGMYSFPQFLSDRTPLSRDQAFAQTCKICCDADLIIGIGHPADIAVYIGIARDVGIPLIGLALPILHRDEDKILFLPAKKDFLWCEDVMELVEIVRDVSGACLEVSCGRCKAKPLCESMEGKPRYPKSQWGGS